MKWIPLVAVVAVAIGAARDGYASSVVVPGSYATIQEAIDSPADTVYVSDGVYEERIRIHEDIVLLPKTTGEFFELYEASPVLRGMLIDNAVDLFPNIVVRGFHFLGSVAVNFTFGDPTRLTFEQCRFDSAFTGPSNYYSPSRLAVRGCLIFGSVAVRTGYLHFIGNSIVGGGLSSVTDGSAWIQHNDVSGSPTHGIKVSFGESSPLIEWNTVRSCLDGILVEFTGAQVNRNRITDSVRDGLAVLRQGNFVNVSHNVIENSGRHGVHREFEGGLGSSSAPLLMTSNAISVSTGCGFLSEGKGEIWLDSNVVVRSGSHGIWTGDEDRVELHDNRITDAGGDGIHGGQIFVASGNVVGRCVGAGVSIQSLKGPLANNTLYSNGGPGVLVEAILDKYPSTVRGNIVAFNTGAGLQWLPPSAPDTSGCNDWFANLAGATLGVDPSPADFDVNPMFCNIALDDVHLSKASPLANSLECGLIGALGTGCGVTAAVAPMPAGSVLGLRVGPTPASGTIQFALNMLDEPATLEVFDITGARRWDTQVPAARGTVEWQGTSHDGRRLPAGVYFARLSTRGGQSATARVLLAR